MTWTIGLMLGAITGITTVALTAFSTWMVTKVGYILTILFNLLLLLLIWVI